jgi:RluA family pseudouridine synthase
VNDAQPFPSLAAIGDVISHIVHRHEPPVTAASVTILHDADGLLVVDKPASIPVHPAGRFHYNTLSEIVQAERPAVDPSSSEHKLGLINRLDRLVSGVSMFAAGAASHRLHAIMRNNDTADAHFTKEYIAKVTGVFPLEAECSVPLTDAIYRVGLVFADRENGRPSSTAFKRIHTDGVHSTVACFPRTGRTHQIRVHLQVRAISSIVSCR